MFHSFVNKIRDLSQSDFKDATEIIREYIDDMDRSDFIQIVKNIGTIPENIDHDSSAEKLYSKASDIVLARCFRCLGLASKALKERSNSADILAESVEGYQYSLVADAKCFRLSRTAKNQKDFKVSNLSDWRGSENEYAVLVAPYFQYPSTKSQIYSKALENNVCLLSWEHICILIENEIKETPNFSLESIWNSSKMISRDGLLYANASVSFLPKIDKLIAKKAGLADNIYFEKLNSYKSYMIDRGYSEVLYWKNEIEKIKNYSREEAIEELIITKKLNEKINVISKYIHKLEK